MSAEPLLVNHIADYLEHELATGRYPISEQGGIDCPSDRPVRRLGLALEPFPGILNWVREQQLDALWLHRPWQLDASQLPAGLALLHHHLPFDETLTMGLNHRLARLLGAADPVRPLGTKQATDERGHLLPPRPIGMLIDVPTREFDAQLATISRAFIGYDRAEAGRHTDVTRLAVVGAMTDTLVRQAAEAGAELYLTGQYRKPAQDAVNQTGMAVIAVGHRRTEEWGLLALAELLRERWPDLTTICR